MDFKEICRRRRTVRFYQHKNVALEHLIAMIDCARRAPSAANNQILRYTVVRNPDLVQAVFLHTAWGGRVTPRRSPEWGRNAPAAFIAVSALRSGPVLPQMAYADAGAAIMTMQYAAADAGLGSCWIGAFKVKEVGAILAVPAKEQLIFLLAVGHPAEKPVMDEIEADGSVAYYLDEDDTLHVPKYSVKAVTRIL